MSRGTRLDLQLPLLAACCMQTQNWRHDSGGANRHLSQVNHSCMYAHTESDSGLAPHMPSATQTPAWLCTTCPSPSLHEILLVGLIVGGQC